MNFIDTMASVELVLAANRALLVGETGIGKTSSCGTRSYSCIRLGIGKPLMEIF